MASIAKLAIRGVRSFSPDDDEQVIEFFFPCTMIVGANGCGKTTIIEALKYAVTGALPPGGAKSGQAFVHDPKSYGHSTIKASVKLRFTNLAGSPMLVVRSMELTQRKSTMTFKALDGVLKMTDAQTGERVSLSHKCTELDRQLPMLLGVSRPILENVVFCHQEDSSWPLMEGAVLKKRFDDIFDSARYAKALEAIRKLGSDYKSKVKDLKANLLELSAHKHAAKDYRKDLERVAEQMEQLEENVTSSKKALKQAEQDLERCKDVLMQTEEARQEIDLRQNELTTEKSVMESQRSMLEEDLTKKHSVAELEDMLRDFDDQRSTLGDEKQRVERRCQALRHDMQQLREEQLRLNSHVGKLTAAKEAHEQRLKQRLNLMEHMARKYGIDLQVTPTQLNQSTTNASFAGAMSQGTSFMSQAGGDTTQDTSLTLSDDDMDAFYRALEEKEKELKDNLSSQKDSNQVQEDQLQRILSEILGKKAALENARAKIQKEYGEASRELQQLANTTRTSRVREGEIGDKRKEAENYAKQRDELINKGRREEIETNIKQLERKIEDIKIGIARDNEALQYLRGRVEKQSEISMLREQTADELSSFKLRLDASRFEFRQCSVDVPQIDLDDEVDGRDLVEAMQRLVELVETKQRRTRIALEKVDSDLSYAQQAFSEKSAHLTHNQQTAETLRRRMEALESGAGSIGTVKRMINENSTLLPEGIDVTKPQQILSFFDEKLQEIDSELDKVDSKPENVIDGLLKVAKATRKVENGEVSEVCPCCARSMDPARIKIFEDVMNKMKNPATSIIVKNAQAKTLALRKQKNKVLDLKKVVSDNMNDLLDFNRCVEESGKLAASVPALKREVSNYQEQLNKAKDDRERLSREVETFRSLTDKANALSQDAARISTKMSDVEEKLKDEETNAGTGSFLDTRSLATVEKELFDKLKKKDLLSDEISNLNKEMSDLNNEITSLTTKASNLDKRVRELEQMFAKSQEETKRKEILIAKVGSFEEEEKKLRTEMTAIQQKLDGKETEKRRFRAAAKDEEEVLSQTLAKFSNDFSELKSLNSQIARYTDSNQSDEFGRISTEIASIESKIIDKEDDLRKAEPNLEALTRRMNDQERHKKNLSANIAILKSERRIIEIEKEVAKLRDELDERLGSDTAGTDLDNAEKRRLELTKDIAGFEGQRREILDQLRSLKRKLDTEEYKNIDERHRRASIMYETTNIAVSDLEKYHSALDKALLRYHGIKVQEINKIIRELWALTYKGEDISSIELVTSQEGASKRSYNYRVVMTKGATQMDMRGRCSAGQRVLASIVIRLALAETFCLNFGCLALDEPTTNLDHNNKKGLATALAQIISARARQSNFQLVIITHDEDFVSMFKTELSSQTGFDMPEKYFQVRREEAADGKFYSKIDAIDWDELL